MKKPAKKRNKKYVQREVQADPISWAIAGVHNFPFATVDRTFEPVIAAVLLLKHGKADRDDWNVVCQALNVAEALADLCIGANLLPQIFADQNALEAIALRMVSRSTATCYASELAAIDEALQMYRAQMSTCTQAEFGRAINRVKRRLLSGAMTNAAALYVQLEAA